MKKIKGIGWIIGSGFLVWVIPFAVSIARSSVRSNDRTFFETIMPVVLTITAVVFLGIRKTIPCSLLSGLIVGVVWLAISIGVDLLMFMWGPMKMNFIDYMKDIGLAYLIYPAIAAGVGATRAGKKVQIE